MCLYFGWSFSMCNLHFYRFITEEKEREKERTLGLCVKCVLHSKGVLRDSICSLFLFLIRFRHTNAFFLLKHGHLLFVKSGVKSLHIVAKSQREGETDIHTYTQLERERTREWVRVSESERVEWKVGKFPECVRWHFSSSVDYIGRIENLVYIHFNM